MDNLEEIIRILKEAREELQEENDKAEKKEDD